MNKCTACGANSPQMTIKAGVVICKECKGENTILNVEQAFEILNNCIHDGVVSIFKAELDATENLVYVNYGITPDPWPCEDGWRELS